MKQADLTIAILKEHLAAHSMIELEQDDILVNGLIIDVQSINLLTKIYDNLKDENQAKFDSAMQDPYKFLNIIDHMWELVA